MVREFEVCDILVRKTKTLRACLTSVDFTDVWARAVDSFASRSIAIHQRGVRQHVCSPQGRFTWKIQEDHETFCLTCVHEHTHIHKHTRSMASGSPRVLQEVCSLLGISVFLSR